MKNVFYILIVISFCFGLQSCSIYNGKVKIDLSDFTQKEYTRKNQYDVIPDYYFEGIDDYTGSKIIFLYMEHPDGFYNDEILEVVKKDLGQNATITKINMKTYVKEKDFKTNDNKNQMIHLITGFKKGYLLISIEGKQELNLNNIINTIRIK